MGIREWIKERAAKGPEDEDRFIEIESPVIVHRDPLMREILAEIARIRKELHHASREIYRLQYRKGLSEFERYQLRRTQEKFERMVVIYRSKESELRELQSRRNNRPRGGEPLKLLATKIRK
jgi:hypothetical protein